MAQAERAQSCCVTRQLVTEQLFEQSQMRTISSMSSCRHLSQLSLVCFSCESIQCKNKKNLSLSYELCVGPSGCVSLNMTPLENFRDSVKKYKSTCQVQGVLSFHWAAYSNGTEEISGWCTYCERMSVPLVLAPDWWRYQMFVALNLSIILTAVIAN